MGPHIGVAASRCVRRACLLSSSLLAIPFWLDAMPAFAQPVALPSVVAAARRFDDFVRELARFNKRHTGRTGGR